MKDNNGSGEDKEARIRFRNGHGWLFGESDFEGKLSSRMIVQAEKKNNICMRP